MNARALAEALRLVAAAIEAPADVPVVVAGQDELVDARGSGVGVKLFRRLVRDGDLVGVRVGRRLMVKRGELDRWLRTQAVQPRAAVPREPKPVESEDSVDALIQREISRGTLRIVKG